MYLAYLDEFGHIGPYVSRNDARYKTHPIFGLGGFILPAESVREFSGFFQSLKAKLLAWEIAQAGVHPARWEKKGASLLTSQNVAKYPEVRLAMNRILNKIEKLGGRVFFYGQQKPIGSPSVVTETSRQRYDHTMIQSIKRLNSSLPKSESLLMILDEVDDKSRVEALNSAAGFMYSDWRGRKLAEAPLQVESHLYATVQAADWICALLSRLTAFQSDPDWAEFEWAQRYFAARLAKVTAIGSKIHAPLAPASALTRSTFYLSVGEAAVYATCFVCGDSVHSRGYGSSRQYVCVTCDAPRLA